MPRISIQFLCSVEREVKLYGKRKVSHQCGQLLITYIFSSDLSLPGVTEILGIHEGGLQTATWSLDLLESVGSKGGQESHPVKQESFRECTVPSSCKGTSHPGHQCLQFGLLFPYKVCLVTHTTPIKTH